MQLVVHKCNLPKTQATEGQIEEAGGRPQKPETGGVLTGYKKVVMIFCHHHSRVILIFKNFGNYFCACSQIVPTASLVSEHILFSL